MTTRRRFIVGGVVVLLAASLWRTVAVERQKRDLAAAFEQAQRALTQLEQERSQLTSTIEGQQLELTGVHDELAAVQVKLQQTVGELSALQREYARLIAQHRSTMDELALATAQKQQLEAKLSSINELKLAIRDIRSKVWRERWARWRARIQVAREHDRDLLLAGNRGYLIRDGASTLGSSTKLHVRVLEPETP